jgi:acyl-CoA reductase-like NAD-dependent aldehyde dehydrogenase
MQRIYVEKQVSEEFINIYSKMAFERLQIGDPMDEQTDIGPLAQLDYLEKMDGKLILNYSSNNYSKNLYRFYS